MNTHTCLHCQAEFTRRTTSRDIPKFCSQSCSATYNNKIKPKRVKGLNSTCKMCEIPIHTTKTYCSDECKTKFKASIKMPGHHNTRHRQARKQQGIDYLGGRCSECGYNKCAGALQFHHVDPSTKSFNISSYTGSWDMVKLELDKCILLCANCHAEHHYTK